MPKETISVRLEIKNPEVKRFLEDFISSLAEFYIKRPDDMGQCDLLIVEAGENLSKTFQLIESVLNKGTVGEVFLTSSELEPGILLQALRSGVKEFLPQPFKTEEMQTIFNNFKERYQKTTAKGEKRGELISITASKGGMGISCIATNLAVALAKLERKVALVELNHEFGEIAIFLNINPTHTWAEIDKNISRLDATYLMTVLLHHSSGIYVLPSSNEVENSTVIKPESVLKTLRLMQTIFDFVVIDINQPLESLPLKAMELSSAILLVSVLNFPCLATTKKFLEVFQQMGYTSQEKVKVIVNRYLNTSEISLKKAEDILKQKVFWTIPNDYHTTMSAINQGRPVTEIAAQAEVTRSFTRLAQTLAHQPEDKRRKRKMSFFSGLFKRQVGGI